MNLKKIIIFLACIFLLAGCGDKTPAGTGGGTVTGISKETVTSTVKETAAVSVSTESSVSISEPAPEAESESEVVGMKDLASITIFGIPVTEIENDEFFAALQNVTGQIEVTDGTCYISINTCYPNTDGLVIPQKYLDLANTDVETEDGVSFEVYEQTVDWYASEVYYMIIISFEMTREWTPEEVKSPVVEEPVVEEPVEPQEEYLEITGDAKKVFDKLVGTWYSPENNFGQMGHGAFYMTINSDGTYCYGEPGENNTIKTVYGTGTFKYKGYNGHGYTFVDPKDPEFYSLYVPADEDRFSFSYAMFDEKLE